MHAFLYRTQMQHRNLHHRSTNFAIQVTKNYHQMFHEPIVHSVISNRNITKHMLTSVILFNSIFKIIAMSCHIICNIFCHSNIISTMYRDTAIKQMMDRRVFQVATRIIIIAYHDFPIRITLYNYQNPDQLVMNL